MMGGEPRGILSHSPSCVLLRKGRVLLLAGKQGSSDGIHDR